MAGISAMFASMAELLRKTKEKDSIMSKNLKSDRESNNTTKHIESTKLDSANKGEVRLDSHGDEIVYEIWHNPNWSDIS